MIDFGGGVKRSVKSRKDFRKSRHVRVRKRIAGTAERPRLAIMISNKHMYVQFIDDESRRTLCAVSTLADEGHGTTVTKAKALGHRAGEAALRAGIARAVVDRGGFKFHGRVRAIVEGAAEAGLGVGAVSRTKAQSAAEASAEKEES